MSAPRSPEYLNARANRPGPSGPSSGSGGVSGQDAHPGKGSIAATGTGSGTGVQSGSGSGPVLSSGKGWRIASTTIEPVIGEQFRLILADRTRLAIWAEQHGAMPQLAEIIGNARLMAQQYEEQDDQAVRRTLLRHLFHRIIMRSGSIILELTPARLINRLLSFSINSPKGLSGEGHSDNQDIGTGTGGIETIVLPLTIRRRGVESRIVLEGPQEQTACHDPALIGLVARAHIYLKALTDGSGTGIGALAERHGLSGSDISRILPMAFLSPRITQSILTGTQLVGLTIARLTRLLDLPIDWQQQQELLEL